MNPVFLVFASLIALSFSGCSWAPRAGPSADEVVEQGRPEGEILFDVRRGGPASRLDPCRQAEGELCRSLYIGGRAPANQHRDRRHDLGIYLGKRGRRLVLRSAGRHSRPGHRRASNRWRRNPSREPASDRTSLALARRFSLLPRRKPRRGGAAVLHSGCYSRRPTALGPGVTSR